MSETLCAGCHHPIRFSDNETGRCEKILGLGSTENAKLCGHACYTEPEQPPEVTDGLFADCRNGQHAECFHHWPPVLGRPPLTCKCPCHPIEPPIRYCTRCQGQIDPKRIMRGSSFCGNDCRREDMKERRAFKASKACRLCGRAARPKPPPKPPEAVCDGSTEEKGLLCQPS